MKWLLNKIYKIYRTYIPIFIITALFLGIVLAKYIPYVLKAANFLVSKLIDSIVFFAPIAIFIVLAPSLAKMMKAGKESGFAIFIIFWFGLTRILAGLWAAVFTAVILRLPIINHARGEINYNFQELLGQNLILLKDLILHNVFFWAIGISIIVGIIAFFWEKLYRSLQKASQSIETFGDYLEPFIPLLMLLLGAYIYSLPQTLTQSVSNDTITNISNVGAGYINLLGFNINIATEFGLVWVYILGSILIGIGCFIWQGMQLVVLKRYLGNFSIKKFFKQYWLKIYPLAWSTSSEVISMPLNMSLIKRSYKEVKRTVRKLVIGLGAYMNINGTTMHVILLAGIVARLIGYEPSLIQLALGVPIIAIVGYGVPGIPGELVLFAVPVVKILNLPEPAIALFMALYLALQVGLPDSFRTGANVTDNGIYALGLNKLFKEKFMKGNEEEEG